jgi:hypothetical protein
MYLILPLARSLWSDPLCRQGCSDGGCTDGYALGVRRDVSVRRSESKYLEFDEIGFKGTTRVDAVWHGDTTAGAVVVLVGGT